MGVKGIMGEVKAQGGKLGKELFKEYKGKKIRLLVRGTVSCGKET